jgi:hypothetical protein
MSSGVTTAIVPQVATTVATEAGEEASQVASNLPPIFYEGVDLNLNFMIAELKKLSPAETINGKLFWKSYSNSWSTLSNEQRNKSITYWRTNITQETRNRIIEASNVQANVELQDETARQAMTVKHDIARLFHIRKDPSLMATWNTALDAKDRAELDAKTNAWNNIAMAFNDYERYKFENACIVNGRTDFNSCCWNGSDCKYLLGY